MHNQNYIQRAINLIEEETKMRGTDYEGLLEVYALLVFIVGEQCTNEHIHDAWSVWQNRTMQDHRSLVPFNELSKEVQDLDEPYRQAVIKAAVLLNE